MIAGVPMPWSIGRTLSGYDVGDRDEPARIVALAVSPSFGATPPIILGPLAAGGETVGFFGAYAIIGR